MLDLVCDVGGTHCIAHRYLLTMLAHQPARYMVVLGLYHGLLVLPVMLSLVQPASIAGIIASPKHGPKSARVPALELDAPKP